MNVLVFNCGSSSQSAKVYGVVKGSAPDEIASLKARNVATITAKAPQVEYKINDKYDNFSININTHREAADQILALLKQHGIKIDAVGHRFVHGGDLFTQTTLLTSQSLEELRSCFPLAPIHNPNSFSVIEACSEVLPGIPQYAIFDTAFHAGLPEASKCYALPKEVAKQNGYHKYGFHGLSLQYVSAKTAELLGKPLDEVKLILCHLGTGGSSVTAFAEGRSVDTSMGFSPLAGLVMSTRCGDVDPGILIDLMRKGYNADEIDQLLNQQSGLIGLSGYSSNLEEVICHAEEGDQDCRTAFEVYANRVRHYLGAYLWALNGADAIVFTDGIGVTSWKLREKVLSNVENLGVVLNHEENRMAKPEKAAWIHAKDSRVKILVIPTDEERIILEEVLKQRYSFGS